MKRGSCEEKRRKKTEKRRKDQNPEPGRYIEDRRKMPSDTGAL